MGGVQSINRNCKKSLLICLQLLVEDVEYYADSKFLAQLKTIQISFSNNFEKNRKKVIDLLKQSIPPQISFHEDVLLNNISSAFQCSLIRSNNYKSKTFKDITMDKEFVKTFRLMNFSGLQQKYENCYQNNLVLLYQGLKSYCNLANQIIKELNQNLDVQCKVYVLIWEHFQNHLCKLSISEIYDLQPLNQFFNENYTIISPSLKIESIGGKLWGTSVQQLNIDYIKQQFKITRRDHAQQNICLFQVFNAFIDMNIDAAHLQWIGVSDFEFSGSLKLLIDFIIEDTNEFFIQLNEKSQGNLLLLLDLWEKDDNFMKSVLPTWICENILNTLFFSFFEQKIREKIKLMQINQQKNLIEKYCKQRVDIDFQNQLEQAKKSLESVFFQFDYYHIQNIEPTLQIMIKQLRSEKEFSSIILASEKTQQGPSDLLIQQNSNILSDADVDVHHIQSNIFDPQDADLFESKQQNSDLLSPEDEIAQICQKYDQKKNNIQLNIQQRDEKIKLRNRNIQPISKELFKVFSFVHSISQEQVDIIVNLLIEKKHKEINFINNNLFVNQECFKGSIAAELLFLMQK
ncbi:unnamed protein product [Paramecium pentaurelia]|uniref:Uncharacterized protein n=1 Tax=Paramecium pentaurelia TaxID=43138 RepID=A0A8S1SV49_9CILI|nr:unnamed protein product [Paramecium pentaurelia]